MHAFTAAPTESAGARAVPERCIHRPAISWTLTFSVMSIVAINAGSGSYDIEADSVLRASAAPRG